MSAIEFKQVEKSFKDGDSTIEALKETNFSVEKGSSLPLLVRLVRERVHF